MNAPPTTGKRSRTPGAAAPDRARAPQGARRDPARLLRLLTAREAELLTRLAGGEELAVIAAELGLSPALARTRLHRAMRKLGVRTTAEAAALVHRASAPPVRARPVAKPAAAPAKRARAARAAKPTKAAEPARAASTGRAAQAARAVQPAEPARAAPPVRAAGVDPGPGPVAFADFCLAAHDRLVQQTFLLTACRHRAVHCAHLALGAASRQWAEISALPDPEGWIRGRAFEAALSPWRRGGPRRAHLFTLPHRRIRVGPAGVGPEDRLTPRDKALLKALRRLSRPRRWALVLHDALGVPVDSVAVQVEASTAAAAGRVRAARAALAREVPDLVGPDPAAPEFGDRLGELLHRAAVHGCATPWKPSPRLLTVESRLRTGAVTGGAALLTVAVGGAVVATLLGIGPAELFRSTPSAPPPLCSTADTGSAGPLLPGAEAGVRSHWCEVAGAKPVVLVRASLVSPSPVPEAAASVAAAAEVLPVAVGCPPLRPCPTGTPSGLPKLADLLR
ncbi:LuxR C-terminal-related transcriptional regulator [Kitasatospora sp. NPDC049258]|uniref:LuxR C-terminal-related transcriptional regulator n=1 Tax=Kitasatospora sp. NPDC049258 TaxID=3155394 RepID=UPI0034427CFD